MKNLIICTLFYIVIHISPLYGFGPPTVIGIMSVTTFLISVHEKISGDSVAIGVINHFGDATLRRTHTGHYVADGLYKAVGAELIGPGEGGSAGGYDDGWLSLGGTSGLVRYTLTDPATNIVYCMDTMWSQDSISTDCILTPVIAHCSYFSGFGVAIGPSLCSTSEQDAFNNWVNFILGAALTSNKGTKNGYQSSDVSMAWEKRSETSRLIFNTMDNKITIKADMSDESEAEIGINIGPNNWDTANCYPKNACPSGYMDRTNGGYVHWACGSSCPGGKYTDYACHCACTTAVPCGSMIVPNMNGPIYSLHNNNTVYNMQSLILVSIFVFMLFICVMIIKFQCCGVKQLVVDERANGGQFSKIIQMTDMDDL